MRICSYRQGPRRRVLRHFRTQSHLRPTVDAGLLILGGLFEVDNAYIRSYYQRIYAYASVSTSIATAWQDIIPLIVEGLVKPIVERIHPLGEAAEAWLHLTEDRPFWKVVLAK
jgi:NADPH:quinone reductase-like Zn-dependent oxidoreductase